MDCIIYFEQWIVSFILNSGLYHLFCTVDCIIYIEQWIVSFILHSGLYHLFKHHESISIILYVTSIMANSVDPDQTLQILAYVQGL